MSYETIATFVQELVTNSELIILFFSNKAHHCTTKKLQYIILQVKFWKKYENALL
jgi:hypothetical protein